LFSPRRRGERSHRPGTAYWNFGGKLIFST